MSEELIDEYIDQPAFKAQTDFAVNEVNRLLASFDSLKKAKSDIANSSGLVDISAAVRQSEKDTQLLLRTQILVANQKKAEIQLDNELLKNARLKEQAADRLLKKQEALSAATQKNSQPEFAVKTGGENDAENIKKTGAVVSELDKKQAEAAISATEFGNANKVATKTIQEETKSSLELNKQLELKKQLDRQAAQELKNTVREENAVKGSLEQRRAALIRLNAVYDNQSPQERASAAGQRLQKIIGGLDTQVKTLESTTGRSQRNVGNYGSAFDKIKDGAGKAFGALRTLANVIPGLGIGGIFLGLFEGISKLVSATSFLGEKQTLLNNIYKESAQASSSQVSVLTILKQKLNDVGTSQQDRIKYVKEYNKIADDGNKIDETQVNNLVEINKQIEKQIGLIVKRAVAKAAESKLDEQASKVVEAQLEVSQFEKYKDARKFTAAELKQLNKEDQKEQEKNLQFNNKNNSDALVQRSRTLKANAALNATALDGAKKYRDAKLKLDKEQAELDRQALLLSPLITPDALSEKSKTETLSKSSKAISDRLSQSFERFKLEQNNLLDLLKEGADDENSVYKVRLDYLTRFNDERKVLINEQLAFDLAKLEEKRSNDVKNLEAEKNKKGADIAGINREIATINFNAAEAAKTAKLKADIELQNADRENFKARKKLLEDFEKTKRDILDQELAYEKFTQDAIDKARKGQLEGMKKFNKTDEELLEERKKKMLSFLETVQNYYSQVSSIISGAINIGTTKKKNEAQLAIDEIERQKDADLKANEARVQSEQDKAANIAIINSRAEQQKRQQEQRQKEADRKQAQADKALSIFQITLNIAKAVASHLGKPYLIALDLALGAAQLAIAAATPIPRFFKGKKKGEAYSGPAMVNDHPDGRTMEVIEHADGSLDFPQGRNVITNVKASDIIHPSVDDFINAALGAAHRDTNRSMPQKQRGDNQLAAALMQQTKLLKKIADKPASTTQATDRGLVQVMHWGAKQIKYVNENTNW